MDPLTDATLDVGHLIEALLAVTPEPPPPELEFDEVLQVAAQMLAERAPYCALLAGLDDDARHVPTSHAAQHALLTDRDARWTARLSQARRALGDQLSSAHRFRAASAAR